MIYHAQVIEADFETEPIPLKRGDWLRVQGSANGELVLERWSDARVIRRSMDRLENLENAPRPA